MATIQKVEVTGEELERRIRVQLEFSVHDAEEMLNKELVKGIADKVGAEWVKLNKKKLTAKLSIETISKEVLKAIVDKAIFSTAIERAQG